MLSVCPFASAYRRQLVGFERANSVLWKWGPDLPYRVSVYDPSSRLPKDQGSWS